MLKYSLGRMVHVDVAPAPGYTTRLYSLRKRGL